MKKKSILKSVLSIGITVVTIGQIIGMNGFTIYSHADENKNYNYFEETLEDSEEIYSFYDDYDDSDDFDDELDDETENDSEDSEGDEGVVIVGEYNDFEYGENETGITITKYKGSDANVVVPQVIDGKNVTKIFGYAFMSKEELVTVQLPDTLNEIGDGVFSGCSSLTEINIPENVTEISARAFHGCSSLTEIDIPENVTKIGNDAFSDCSSLMKINIPENVTEIGSGAFSGCSSITNINIPENVNVVESDTFAWCTGLSTIDIPENVTEIGSRAFMGCSSLTEINILENVTKIGDFAFYGCSSLTDINIPQNINVIEPYTFASCTGLSTIDIPQNVTEIGKGAFYYCKALKIITFPDVLLKIDDKAFYTCNALYKADIPESVTYIGSEAFSGCKNLINIHIPANVEYIGEAAFGYGHNFWYNRTITVSSDNQYFDSRNDCNAIIRTSDNTLIAGCSTTVIPDDVVSIGAYAFYGIQSIEDIVIPNSVTSIGKCAFNMAFASGSVDGVDIEASVYVPASVTNIADGQGEEEAAFYSMGKFVIICDENSYAQSYAEAHNITYRFKDAANKDGNQIATPGDANETVTPGDNDDEIDDVNNDKDNGNGGLGNSDKVTPVKNIIKPTVSTVTNLKSNATATSLSINWNKVSGAEGYQLQVSTSKKFSSAKTVYIDKSSNSYVVKKLKQNKNYYIRVRAYKTYTDADGKIQSVTGEWTTITKKTPPVVAKVKSVKATTTKNKATVTWKKASGTSGYQIQISTSKKFKNAKSINIKKTKKKYIATKLKSNKKYYIRVRAYKTYKDENGKTKKLYGSWTTINKKTKK